jgi:hypothetical protein
MLGITPDSATGFTIRLLAAGTVALGTDLLLAALGVPWLLCIIGASCVFGIGARIARFRLYRAVLRAQERG